MKYRIREIDSEIYGHHFQIQVRVLWFVWLNLGYGFPTLERAQQEIRHMITPPTPKYHYVDKNVLPG
jgi:hypothetical protein